MPFASPRVGCSIGLVGPGELPCRWASPSIHCVSSLWGHVACYPEEEGGLRPIAVWEVLRRLTSKCLSHAIQHAASLILCPPQLGVGIRSGYESIVHAVARLMEHSDIPPGEHWILYLDFSNAFNSIDRESIFLQFRDRLPSLSAWIESCYSS